MMEREFPVNMEDVSGMSKNIDEKKRLEMKHKTGKRCKGVLEDKVDDV